MRYCLCLLILCIFFGCQTKEFTITNVLQFDDENLQNIIANKPHYEVQIRYTQIDRDEENKPVFTHHNFNVDTNDYFYPASTIKMPVAFLALQRLNELQKEGFQIDRNSSMVHDSIRPIQSPAKIDTTTKSGLPNIGQYINKLFVVSDNNAYNRLYEFLGQDYINKELRKKNIFSNSRIVTRVGIPGFDTEENKHANPVRFYNENKELLFLQQASYSKGNYFSALNSTKKGKGYYSDELESTIMEPFDMGAKNFINIIDLEASLMRVIFPDAFLIKEKYQLTESDYDFLYESMDRLPRHYEYLRDQPELNYDGYVKLFMFGDTKERIPEHIHIFNKVGFAYGYLTDCAYIFDTKNNIEFFLTATIHVNDNQIYNDGKYEYDELGIPFLAELGRKIYDRELGRERTNQPDLSNFINI